MTSSSSIYNMNQKSINCLLPGSSPQEIPPSCFSPSFPPRKTPPIDCTWLLVLPIMSASPGMLPEYWWQFSWFESSSLWFPLRCRRWPFRCWVISFLDLWVWVQCRPCRYWVLFGLERAVPPGATGGVQVPVHLSFLWRARSRRWQCVSGRRGWWSFGRCSRYSVCLPVLGDNIFLASWLWLRTWCFIFD